MPKHFAIFLIAMICTAVFSSHAQAGQAFIISKNGSPVLWDASGSSPVSIHIESGSCGRFSNDEIVSRLATNLEEWTTLNDTDIAFSIVTGSITGVDACNYDSYLVGVEGTTSTQDSDNVNDGLNPILLDDDGEIVDAATGEANGRYTILGFANPAGFSTSSDDATVFLNIVDGQALFNCYCLDDGTGSPQHSDCGSTVFTTDDLDFTMIHELGHFLNLDHTQVNHSFATDSDTSNDDDLPAMYPLSINAGVQKTPTEDDAIAVSSLYPAGSFFTSGDTSSTYCKVTGTLLDQFGSEMRCADVQATTDDTSFNVGFVSGAHAPAVDNNADDDTGDDSECLGNCGDFTLYLRPGTSYTLQARPIEPSFIGGSGISPCSNNQVTECTTTLLSRCTDNTSSTTCKACVNDETLSTNDGAEDIATKITAECTAGATVALGNITTSSVSSDSAATETLVKGSFKSLAHEFILADRILRPASTGPLLATSCPESNGDGDGDGGGLFGCALAAGKMPKNSPPLTEWMVIVLLSCLGMTRLTRMRSTKLNDSGACPGSPK